MDEEELNGINFRNKDVMYINSRSTAKGVLKHHGSSKATFESSRTTSTPTQTSSYQGRMVQRPGTDYYVQTKDKFKTVTQEEDGNWYVGKVRTSPFTGERRATRRQITEQAANRKMNRMRKKINK